MCPPAPASASASACGSVSALPGGTAPHSTAYHHPRPNPRPPKRKLTRDRVDLISNIEVVTDPAKMGPARRRQTTKKDDGDVQVEWKGKERCRECTRLDKACVTRLPTVNGGDAIRRPSCLGCRSDCRCAAGLKMAGRLYDLEDNEDGDDLDKPFTLVARGAAPVTMDAIGQELEDQTEEIEELIYTATENQTSQLNNTIRTAMTSVQDATANQTTDLTALIESTASAQNQTFETILKNITDTQTSAIVTAVETLLEKNMHSSGITVGKERGPTPAQELARAVQESLRQWHPQMMAAVSKVAETWGQTSANSTGTSGWSTTQSTTATQQQQQLAPHNPGPSGRERERAPMAPTSVNERIRQPSTAVKGYMRETESRKRHQAGTDAPNGTASKRPRRGAQQQQ